jgi:protein gp37
MGERTGIAWTSRTWNPWRGCTRVSPGCAYCYMFTAQERYGRDPNIVTRTKTWNDPIRWEREAAAARRIDLVFTCSWSDWFHVDADPWRDEAWAVIRRCPHLTFQILTKRHERIADHLPADWGAGYPNVWLGVSIENDRFVHRADALRTVPAVVHFLSLEPLLGPLPSLNLTNIQWVITGGESGADFRPMDHAWCRDIRDRCVAQGIAYFQKQSAALRTEMGTYLEERDGSRWAWKQYPGDFAPPVRVS